MQVNRSGYKLSGHVSIRSKNVHALPRIRSLKFTSDPSSAASMRRSSSSDRITGCQGPKFLVGGFLTLLAACLALGMVASIVLEAFDGDSDLWQFGAEDFIAAAHGESLTGSHVVGGLPAPSTILCMAMTAGAYLVLRHRARSALAIDSRLTSMAFTKAEPRSRRFCPSRTRPFLSLEDERRRALR